MHLECKRCVELFDVSDVMSLTNYEHEVFKDKRLYVDRPIKMNDELSQIFRILKIKMPRYDLKLEPYTCSLK